MALTREGTCNVSFVETLEEIEALRPDWERLHAAEDYRALNANIDYYLAVLGPEGKPCVAVVRKNGEVVGLVVGRLEETHARVRLGYRTIFTAPLRCFVVIHGGWLGLHDRDLCMYAVDAMIRICRQKRLDAVFVSHLDTRSVAYDVLSSRRCVWERHEGQEDLHWRMAKPPSLDAFYRTRSHSHRSNLRRLVRKLDPKARVEALHKDSDVLNRILQEIPSLSVKTYQHALGAGFSDTPLMRRLLSTGLREGWTRVYLLSVDGQAAAFLAGACYGETLFVSHMGYDAAFSSMNPGTVLFLKVLEEACRDPVIRFIDFGFGDADYKRSYADQSWTEASFRLFAPRPYPFLVGSCCSTANLITSAAHWLAEKSGLEARVKRLWRSRLRQRTDKSPAGPDHE